MKYDIKNLTIDEKINLLIGKDRWRISDANGKLPEFFMADGPCGLRKEKDGKQVPATAMPTLSTLSYSWDPELAYLEGATIADECIEHDVDLLLAPGVNIKRTPLCGRNFEYLSEDPFLAGELGKAYIEGVQDKGVGTSLKHFIANNREYERRNQTSEIDERTLREIYLPAFEKSLEAKPWTVMCSYNPINGVWASENKKMLNDLLREELGFDGAIISDWGAVHDAPRAVKATLDLTMPRADIHEKTLREAYERGEITEADLDARIEKLFDLIYKAKTAERKVELTKESRHANALKIAKESMVLLKNEDNILPLKSGKILVGGKDSEKPVLGGGGSAYVTTAHEFRPLSEQLSEYLGKEAQVDYAPLFDIGRGGIPNRVLNSPHLYSKAYSADTVVLCISNSILVEGEAFDRTTLRLTPAQEDVILNTAKLNKNVIVVLYVGSVIDMTPWIDKVKGVVLAGYTGDAVNEALAQILTGRANPCGKVTETYPLCLEDTPTGDKRGNGFYERYTEGVLVGYRWYDTLDKDVLFPFGYGLSYSDFEYSDLEIEKLGETDYNVSFTVKNISDVDGKEISQVYVRDVMSMVERPLKELKGFTKIALAAGESKRVSVKLDYRSFAYYSTALDRWHVENGDFEILVGASSRDIRLMGKLNIQLPRDTQFTTPVSI